MMVVKSNGDNGVIETTKPRMEWAVNRVGRRGRIGRVR